jgi:hypothetical protein
LLGFKEIFGVLQRTPAREMHDVIGIGIKLEQLITDFSGFFADLRCIVKNFFPCCIIFNFVNDENVLPIYFWRVALLSTLIRS